MATYGPSCRYRSITTCSKVIRESSSNHSFFVITLAGGMSDPEYHGVLGSPPSRDVVVRYRS